MDNRYEGLLHRITRVEGVLSALVASTGPTGKKVADALDSGAHIADALAPLADEVVSLFGGETKPVKKPRGKGKGASGGKAS